MNIPVFCMDCTLRKSFTFQKKNSRFYCNELAAFLWLGYPAGRGETSAALPTAVSGVPVEVLLGIEETEKSAGCRVNRNNSHHKDYGENQQRGPQSEHKTNGLQLRQYLPWSPLQPESTLWQRANRNHTLPTTVPAWS